MCDHFKGWCSWSGRYCGWRVTCPPARDKIDEKHCADSYCLTSAGIKAIKLHAWEKPFLERMRVARSAELDELRCAASSASKGATKQHALHDQRQCWVIAWCGSSIISASALCTSLQPSALRSHLLGHTPVCTSDVATQRIKSWTLTSRPRVSSHPGTD